MANGADQSTNHTSNFIAEKSDILETLKVTMSSKLRLDSPMSATCCIFRVPHLIRRHNQQAYQPQVVSIGPLHRGGKQFQFIETVKQWYLQNLLSSMNISLPIFIDRIHEFFEQRNEGIIDQFEKRARDFYAEPLHDLNQNDFIEMMILDACFLIQLFRFIHNERKNINNDPIFNMDCMFQHIGHDILLLENQIPWFVLKCLYKLTRESYPHDHYPPLHILMLTVFTSQPPLAHSCKFYAGHLRNQNDHDDDDDDKILHILDLIRTSIVFPFKEFVPSSTEYKKCLWIKKKQRKNYGSEIPPATTLSQAGIKFESGSPESESIMNIQFKRGVFTIPQLEIGELTEPLFRNLIAFEQCYHDRSHQITSYAVLMDKLLGSSKDMEFLCEKGIIGNWLSAEDGSQFFNKLYNDTLLKKFFYQELCAEVNRYYEVTWNKWLEKLKREYFANPWTVISLIAASVLLGLTIVQTIYAVRQ